MKTNFVKETKLLKTIPNIKDEDILLFISLYYQFIKDAKENDHLYDINNDMYAILKEMLKNKEMYSLKEENYHNFFTIYRYFITYYSDQEKIKSSTNHFEPLYYSSIYNPFVNALNKDQNKDIAVKEEIIIDIISYYNRIIDHLSLINDSRRFSLTKGINNIITSSINSTIQNNELNNIKNNISIRLKKYLDDLIITGEITTSDVSPSFPALEKVLKTLKPEERKVWALLNNFQVVRPNLKTSYDEDEIRNSIMSNLYINELQYLMSKKRIDQAFDNYFEKETGYSRKK